MKKTAKILIAIGLGLVVAGAILWNCNTPNPPTPPAPSSNTVDTTKYTDVVLINKSNLDSVKVYVTLPSTQSIVGKFGMDSSNIYIECMNINGKDTTYCPCKGTFWAKKGVEYHWGDTVAAPSVVVTWGVDNQACTTAQNGQDASDNGQKYPFGVNIFEFTVNTWWQNGKTLGANESFDISCVDGLHSVLKQRVTSFGPRDNSGLNPNFGAYWDYGYIDSTGHHAKFVESMNGIDFKGCVNIPGVFPYGCDWGYKSEAPPTPCSCPSYSVECSTKYGNINTSQTNRQGQGGQVICEFLGYTKDAVPAEK